jgi:hypothetical protein
MPPWADLSQLFLILVHRTKARRLASNFTKLPELLGEAARRRLRSALFV